MKTYSNGLLSASGDLTEYTVTKTDESGTARSETCTVSQKEIAAVSSGSNEPAVQEVSPFSSVSAE